MSKEGNKMSTSSKVSTPAPDVHIAASSLSGVLFHSPETSGNNGGVAGTNDATSSDITSAGGANKGSLGAKAVVQTTINISGGGAVRFSNPA
jgi:hypothetical protein